MSIASSSSRSAVGRARYWAILPHAARRPDQHVLPRGVTQVRWRVGEGEAGGGGHGVLGDRGGGGLERPPRVVDVAAEERAARAGGVEAVALGEPVIEPAGRGMVDGTDRPVG